MKTNKISVSFTQLIPARKVNVKDKVGNVTEKMIDAYVVEASFTNETDKEITANDVANYFTTRLKCWQNLRPLQGEKAFKTSRPINIEISVNNKKLTGTTKFTTNPDRLFKCLENQKLLVAELGAMATAPVIFKNDKEVQQFLLGAGNITFAKSRKQLSVAAGGAIEEAVLIEEKVNA